MHQHQPPRVTLNNILITEELSGRSPRPPNWQAQAQAMQPLARQMAQGSQSLLQTLADIALELCQAGTAGVSLLETTPDGEELFRWVVLAGTLAHHVGGSTPRNFSPCGVCLEYGTPVLFSHPERYFTYFQEANTPIVEGLVLPLIADNHALGTIWIMSHDSRRHFDAEDVRVMTSLADFTAAALLLKQRQTQELLAKNAQLEAEVSDRQQTEIVLCESEERSRVLIQNLPGGAAFVVDRDLRYLLAQGEALSAAGFKSEDFVGKTIFEVLPPELAASYEVTYRRGLAGESFEHEHHAHDRSFISRGTPLRSADGEVYAVLVVSYDITERKQAEAAIAADLRDTQLLQDLSVRMVGETDVQVLYDEIMGAAIALMQADAGSLQFFDEATQELVIITAQCLEQFVVEHFRRVNASSNTSCGIALRTGDRTFVDFDVSQSEDPDGSLRLHLEAGLLSAQSTPLITRSGKAIGMISTHWRKHHRPGDRELRFLDLLARQAADLIEQRQAEQTLRESEEKYRTLFNSMDEGFHIIELIDDEAGEVTDYRFLEGNPAFERLTGLKNAAGKLGSEIAPKTESYWIEAYSRVAQTGESLRIENYSEDTKRWYAAYASRVGGVGSRQVAIVFDDITMRKQAEAALCESKERQAFLLQLSDAIRPLTDSVDIQQTVTKTAMNYFGADRCYYCEIEDGNAIILRDASREDLPTVAGVYPLSRFAIFQAVVDAGRPFIVQDVHTTDMLDEDLRRLCIQLQVISYINVPVIKNGKPVGILCLVQGTPRDWTDLEVELATETAERTWAAVERARAEEQLRRAAQMDMFRVKLSDALRSLSDAFEIQATVTRTTMNFFGADRCYYCEIIDGSAIIRRDASQADLPSVVGVYPLNSSPIFRAMLDAGQPFVFQDVHTTNVLDENLRQTCLQLQIISGINVPVIKQGEPVGILAITQTTPRNWTEFEMDLAEEIADRTWATIERTRAEAALREAELQRVREQSAREQERQRAESLAELDRAKTLFFSNVSHEFRTPLTLLLAPLQDALSDRTHPLPQEQCDRLELVQRNAIRLLKLVNTLLDFSRIEAGRMEAVYEPTDLAMFTTELASVFRSAIERAGLRLIVDCPPLAAPVYVDRQMWEKIVLNLLSNAFKFTFEGEIAVRLHLADDDRVTLQVEDTGTGIEPEQLPHLFERFYQVRGAKARIHEGSGIGLALVQELIKLHGGTVDITSALGVGSCFTVTIPLGTAHLPCDRLRLVVGDRIQTTRTLASTALNADPYVQEAERWITEEAGGQGSRGAGGKFSPLPLCPSAPLPSSARVLIVDDNADMRDYLTRILSEHHEAIAVADGATALAVATQRVPDLVLSDVMMPGLDGFELLKALRADARTKEVPIILLSARAGEESVIEGLLAGADDYLIKPFSANELVTRVNAYLQMAHLRLEALHDERAINRRKDEVLSTVSHELNTPLVAILGWTRLLRSNSPSPAMLSKALETIERNATLQAKLVEDLLDISRITAGKISLNLEPVQLQGLIENAIATVQQSRQTRDIRLNCLLASLPITVQGDPDRLQQIVLNLLTNAFKFTPDGGRVAVSLESYENQAQLIISDTGCGIDAEFLPYIFETFRQAPSTKKGLGLGLAIAHTLVQLHGGIITVQSPGIGQGTTFTVNLPLILSFHA